MEHVTKLWTFTNPVTEKQYSNQRFAITFSEVAGHLFVSKDHLCFVS